jgi:hypothetical protein
MRVLHGAACAVGWQIREGKQVNYIPYREAIKNKVCSHCVDCTEERKCALTGEDRCGVEIHLEKIVQVVRSVKSARLEDYVKALRDRVCSQCKRQNLDGTCQLRNVAECGLDRYFELVVEAIEEVDRPSS